MNQSVKRPVFAGLGLFLLASSLVGSMNTRSASPQRQGSKAKSSAAQIVGELFKSNCARCHGGDGRGNTALGRTYQVPDFADPEWWRKNSKITSTPSLIAIVSRGKGGMPAFGKKLTRTQIRFLISYVRRFKNQKSPI